MVDKPLLVRSIPACAGEPITKRTCAIISGPQGLSPRVRGNRGRVTGARCNPRAYGLSPRVRGNLFKWDYTVSIRHGPVGLSPRVRGNPCARGWVNRHRLTGLSPRVRGNPSTTMGSMAKA